MPKRVDSEVQARAVRLVADHLREYPSSTAANKTHRQHAIIEQTHADLKGSALAHQPSGSFAANAAWLVLATIAFTSPAPPGQLPAARVSRPVTATVRCKLVNVPARITTSARQIRLRLPNAWPWQTHWTALFDTIHQPPRSRKPRSKRNHAAAPRSTGGSMLSGPRGVSDAP